MPSNIASLRAAISQPPREFGSALDSVLSPSRPLQSEEFLRGRAEQLQGIERALYASGRHVLIHGLRGVGKSSLAQTAAFKCAEAVDPIIVSCDRRSTLQSVIKDVFDEAVRQDPRVHSTAVERKAQLQIPVLGLGLGGGQSETHGEVAEPLTVNHAVRLLDFLCDTYAARPMIVVDEFDLIDSTEVQEEFTTLIKQISDRHVPATFIFCGIGESADAIMAAHGSADRYFHAVELGQLPWEARFEIVRDAAEKLGIGIDEDTVIRIARISDGFPHYVHFIAEKLFWKVYEAENEGEVTPELFDAAMDEAAGAMDMKLRGPYEIATQKYGNDYEAVLWAVADGHELRRRSSDIFESYVKITRQLGTAALTRDQFNSRINRLKQPAHGQILTGTRQGWYEFTEKMIRGYVRLKAERAGADLATDHPRATQSQR